MAKEILLPEMGEGVIEGTLSRWLVKAGDAVEEYDPIAEVETDKVTTEIMSEFSGTILELCVGEGDTVPVETAIALIAQKEEMPDPAKNNDYAHKDNGRLQAIGQDQNLNDYQPYTGRISPVVSRIAGENGIDLGLVTGTGRDGRITKQDILAYMKNKDTEAQPDVQADAPTPALTPVPESSNKTTVPIPISDPVPGETFIPHSGMRLAIAEHMVRSKQTSPHVTTVFEFDFSAVAAHRALNKEQFAKDGARLTFTVYIVAATVQALKQHPQANSVWTDEGIIHKGTINIGMAAAVRGGLIVPVIKGADGLNLLGLARAINDLTDRARDKKLTADNVRGGTFSITNHGTSGSLLATPIINQPQAGILGIGKIEKRVKVIDDAIAIRPLAYASFTFDHRILDGATADAFVSRIKAIIEKWQ